MESTIFEIAERIKALRDILEISVGEMTRVTGTSPKEYLEFESGKKDFTFTFIFKCAERFGVDFVELLTGDRPKLSFYNIIRQGKGLPMKRREGFLYQHLAPNIKNKLAEPFLVTAPYSEEEQNQPIHLSTHEGQEFDYILKGSLKVAMENHIEILNEGDAIFYDSGHGHGMIATGGADCQFLAVVIKHHDKTEESSHGSSLQ